MPLTPPKPLPPPLQVAMVVSLPGIEGGPPRLALSRPWLEWFASNDAAVRLLANAQFATLANAVNDAAAAAAGVPIGGLYRNVNAVQIRLV